MNSRARSLSPTASVRRGPPSTTSSASNVASLPSGRPASGRGGGQNHHQHYHHRQPNHQQIHQQQQQEPQRQLQRSFSPTHALRTNSHGSLPGSGNGSAGAPSLSPARSVGSVSGLNGGQGGFKLARTLLYLVGFGCFVHIILVRPPTQVAWESIGVSSESLSSSSPSAYASSSLLSPLSTADQEGDSPNTANATIQQSTLPTTTSTVSSSPVSLANRVNEDIEDKSKKARQQAKQLQQLVQLPSGDDGQDGGYDHDVRHESSHGAPNDDDGDGDGNDDGLGFTLDDVPCDTSQPQPKSPYRLDFEASFPVEAPYQPVDDWDAIPCARIPRNCNLHNDTFGIPFIMISFGRAGTTATWDIMAGLTGEHIPRATEDMGRDKAEARQFFAQQNQTEHGKCWLQRLLCHKQAEARAVYKAGQGKSSFYGSKWKPWHQGLNTTQAREALQWLGNQSRAGRIKVLHNTRNMVDMYISKNKHSVLDALFGEERTAHCYDDHDIVLSDKVWARLEQLGITRDTPCAQIFKDIERRTRLRIPHMLDYFEKNVLQTDFASEMLDFYGVSRETVTYEKLYFTGEASEWRKIFRYMGFGPTHANLTLDEVFANTAFLKTSANDRSKRMANYQEVVQALRCTRYAKYLD